MFAAGLVGYHLHDRASHAALGLDMAHMIGSRYDASVAFSFSTLLFGSVFIVARDLLLPVLAVIAVAAPFVLPRRADGLMVGIPVLVHMLAFVWFGEPGSSQYYGFAYVPLLLFGASCVFATRVPSVATVDSATVDSAQAAL